MGNKWTISDSILPTNSSCRDADLIEDEEEEEEKYSDPEIEFAVVDLSRKRLREAGGCGSSAHRCFTFATNVDRKEEKSPPPRCNVHKAKVGKKKSRATRRTSEAAAPAEAEGARTEPSSASRPTEYLSSVSA